MWDNILSHWNDWGHPLRPNVEDIALYQSVIYSGEKRLLLGMTPELMFHATDHADLRSNGIDWFNMPYEKQSFDVIFGDGVLLLTGPRLIDAIKPFVKPGGRIVFRTFMLNTSLRISGHIDIRKFQCWNKNYVPVQEIYNREGDHPTTRDYNGSKDIYYFAQLDQLPTFHMVLNPSYEYGEFYPVIVWTV
jgi:hypothetical protein